jgi:hypothetical protein
MCSLQSTGVRLQRADIGKYSYVNITTVVLCCVLQLLVTANIGPSSLMLSSLMMADTFLQTSVLSMAKWCHFPEDGILHRHCRENLKCYECVE